MRLSFKTKTSSKLWCEAGNELAIRVEIICARWEAKAMKTGDARLRALANDVYSLQKQFSEGLQRSMKSINAGLHIDRKGRMTKLT